MANRIIKPGDLVTFRSHSLTNIIIFKITPDLERMVYCTNGRFPYTNVHEVFATINPQDPQNEYVHVWSITDALRVIEHGT